MLSLVTWVSPTDFFIDAQLTHIPLWGYQLQKIVASGHPVFLRPI